MPTPKRSPCVGAILSMLPAPNAPQQGDLELLGLLGKKEVEEEGEREEQVSPSTGLDHGSSQSIPNAS